MSITMKMEMLTRAGVTMTVMFLAGCASAGTPDTTPEPELTTPTVAAPLPGENFLVYYTDGVGLRRRDTRVGSDAIVSPRSPAITNGEATFGMELAALAQRTSDSTWLRILTEGADAPRTVHSGGDGEYTYAWSADRRQLAFGFQPRSGRAGGVWIVSGQGDVQSVGCSASNRVHAWRSNSELLVSDSRNVYAVNAQTCATLATLPKQGKHDFAFASGGGKLSFARGPELYIANHNGSGSQKIADPQVAARNASWASDGSKVAFVINSPQFADRTHVAVHDVASRRISYNDQESPLGVPNESNPCWSPDSRRLMFDRVFDRSDGVQTYQTHQKVIKRENTETVVFEELVRDGRRLSNTTCTWVDDRHILAAANAGFVVINVDDRSEYSIGEVESVLMVRVYE